MDTIELVYRNKGIFVLPDNIENLVMASDYSAGSAIGNPLDNQIFGNQYNNVLDGGKGGADLLVGGAGNDVYIMEDIFDAIVERRNEGTDGIQSSAGYSLLFTPHAENLMLTGTANVNAIGNARDNVLTGNVGANILTGNAGKDNFVFGTALGSSDTIADFASGIDRISLAKSVFTSFTIAARFSVEDTRFYAAPDATAAHDATDRIIYNTSSGALFYDADGNETNLPSIQIAVLSSHPSLIASDLWIV